MKGLLHARSLSGIVYKPEEIPDSAKIDASLFRENLSKARDLPAEKLLDKKSNPTGKLRPKRLQMAAGL